MKLAVRHLCPACREDAFGFAWSSADWDEYRRVGRTLICRACAILLRAGPADPEPRLMTTLETFQAHVEIPELEALQVGVLRRHRIVCRRVR